MAELRYVDWDGLVYYDGKIKSFIEDKSEDYLKMGGIVSFAELPDPTYYNLNYIYKITEEFTSNSRFENPGYVYKAGTWVQVTDINNSSIYRYTIFNEEVLGGTADLSNYYTKEETHNLIKEAISDVQTSFVTRDEAVTKDELSYEVTEKINNGDIEVSKITYGEF